VTAQDILNLIDVALVDGKLDDAERKMLLSKAKSIGIDGAGLASMIESRQRTLSADGLVRVQIKKCPSCQAIIDKELMVTCEYCGASLSSTLSSNKVDEFHSRIMNMSSDRRHELIKSYPLPTEKNEIVAFLSLSTSLAVESLSFFPDIVFMSGEDERNRINERRAWLAKTQALISNSRVIYANDPSMQAILDGYSNQIEQRSRSIRNRRVSSIGVVYTLLAIVSINPIMYEVGVVTGVMDTLGRLLAISLALIPVAALSLIAFKRFQKGAYVSIVVGIAIVLMLISEDFREMLEDFVDDGGGTVVFIGFLGWLVYRKVTAK
jgi:hypothetical protein